MSKLKGRPTMADAATVEKNLRALGFPKLARGLAVILTGQDSWPIDLSGGVMRADYDGKILTIRTRAGREITSSLVREPRPEPNDKDSRVTIVVRGPVREMLCREFGMDHDQMPAIVGELVERWAVERGGAA